MPTTERLARHLDPNGHYPDFRARVARQMRGAARGEVPGLKIGLHEAADFALIVGAPSEKAAVAWAERFVADVRSARALQRAS